MLTGGHKLEKGKEKNKSSLLSNLSMSMKFAVMVILSVLAAAVMALVMLISVYNTRSKKYDESEKLIITSTEQIVEMAIENGVSIAGKLYDNENLFKFLDYKYKDSQEYYDAFYNFHHNNPLATAETNLIRRYMIYTNNPTILSGTDVIQLDTAKDSGWYTTYNKLKKTLILYCDPETGSMSLIRKINTDTCNSYLKLDINTSLLKNYIDALGFDGELYIVSGQTMIYSCDDDVKIDDLVITKDFDCFAKNYYSSDIEYYAVANGRTSDSLVSGGWFIIFLFMVFAAAIMAFGVWMSINIRNRIDDARDAFKENADFSALKEVEKGDDEIGELLQLCVSISESLSEGSSEFMRNSNELKEKIQDYSSLFKTAMRLDAELIVGELYPELLLDDDSEEISLAREGELIRKLSKKFGMANVAIEGELSENLYVPAYSLMLLADQLFHSEGRPSVTLSSAGNRVNLIYDNDVRPSSARILKLQAIFEDANVTDEYSFNRRNVYNPYLRLKHCFGDRASVEMASKTGFQMTISILINAGKEG